MRNSLGDAAELMQRDREGDMMKGEEGDRISLGRGGERTQGSLERADRGKKRH